jgi:glutathione S-transferase
MDLYFAPLACSMATRIALYEAGGAATFIQVEGKTKRLPDDGDFRDVNPLGQVPVIRTDQGPLLTENSAILQYVARRHPEAKLLGRDDELPWLQQWVSFVSTEVHKGVFTPLFDAASSEETKGAALRRAASRLDVLEKHLAGREYLLDSFTIADAYLTTVLNWCRAVSLDLNRWPAVMDYFRRMQARPSVARAMQEEGELYVADQARQAA